MESFVVEVWDNLTDSVGRGGHGPEMVTFSNSWDILEKSRYISGQDVRLRTFQGYCSKLATGLH